MAGTLTVQNLQGPSSGANANTVLLPSGQTLYAPGHVVQVVSDTYSSAPRLLLTTSTKFVASGLSVSISPTSTSSKVLAMVSSSGNNNDNTYCEQLVYTLYRGSTDLGGVSQNAGFGQIRATAGTAARGSIHLSFLDSPATTSATTYELYGRSTNSRTSVEFAGISGTRHTITLMEIAQ